MSFPGSFNLQSDLSAITNADGEVSSGNQNTTTPGWNTKSNFPYTTTAVYQPGVITISFTAEVGQSEKQKQVGSRFQWRETGGSWQTISDIRNGLSEDNQYELRTGFVQIPITFTNTVDIRCQWGQIDNGGIGRIRKVSMQVEQASTT